MSSSRSSLLRYEGCNFLRQRLVLATLSNRSIEILKIREDEEEPGLRGNKIINYYSILNLF